MRCRNSEVLNGYAYISLAAEELGCDFEYVMLDLLFVRTSH